MNRNKVAQSDFVATTEFSNREDISGVFGNLVLHPCISNFIKDNYNELLIICNVDQLNELRWNFIIDCIDMYPLQLRNTSEFKKVLKNLLNVRYSFPIILDNKRIKNILLNSVDYHLNNNGMFLSSLINTLFPDSYQ